MKTKRILFLTVLNKFEIANESLFPKGRQNENETLKHPLSLKHGPNQPWTLPSHVHTVNCFSWKSFSKKTVSWKFKIFRFWLGGAAPQTPRFLAGGAKPPQTPPLNGRPQHLIEAAKRGRLDQMPFFRRR